MKNHPSPRNSTLYDSLFFFVLAILGIIFSIKTHYGLGIEWKLSPYLFPLFISLMLLALSIVLFLESTGKKAESSSSSQATCWKKIVLAIVFCFIYYFLVRYTGFLLTTTLLLVALFVLLGVRRWWFIALLSVGFSLIIWLFFGRFLHVMLPSGLLFFYLGL